MTYKSTRSDQHCATASQAILNGIAPDGGLYTLDHLPTLSTDTLRQLVGASYQDVAKTILPLFLNDFTQEEIDYCVNSAYGVDNFNTDNMVVIQTIANRHYLELFHGKTLAFKDMALSILPYFMKVAAKKNHLKNELVILTATSGDTGKAALEAFKDVDGIHIFVFYPKEGVSPIQEKQMVTQSGNNVHVFGITGNFDDAQSQVKQLFNDNDLNSVLQDAGYQLTSANSINIGRLVPQIVYYVYAYAELVNSGKLTFGQPLNVSVPTGNFGNILAAYYAKALGVPLNTLLCASNENHVLSDFFQTGTYDKNRPFIVTNSPSMDILISSNLERLIYHATQHDAKLTQQLMAQLNETGSYALMDDGILNHFVADYISQDDTLQHIKAIFDETGYVIDTHTAVASALVERYERITNDSTPTLIAATASPYKFPQSVLGALTTVTNQDDFDCIQRLSQLSQTDIPQSVADLMHATIRFSLVIDATDIRSIITNHFKG